MPTRQFRLSRLIPALAAPFLLGACSLLGFGSSDRLPDIMPSDFRFVHSVREATQPPMDYTMAFDRSGVVTYDVTVRAPRRDQYSGTFEATESHLQRLYAALLAAEFDSLPDVLDVEQGSERRDIGDRAYFARGGGYEKRVEARFTDTPELAMIRKEMLADVPESVFAGQTETPDVPMRLVAEDVNHQFHRAECKVLQSVGTAGRRDFGTVFEALDYGYDPCEACNPTRAGGR